MVTCLNCGHDNQDDARYCDNCGVEIGRATTPDTHPDEAVDDTTVAGPSSWTQREQQPPEGDIRPPSGNS